MGKSNEDALHRLETFPMNGDGKFRHVIVENIFPKDKASTTNVVAAIQLLADYKKNPKQFKTKLVKVSPSDLVPTQFGIFRNKIKNDIEDTSKKPIIVWLSQGFLFILDGHHRAASAILTGKSVVNAIVIEV